MTTNKFFLSNSLLCLLTCVFFGIMSVSGMENNAKNKSLNKVTFLKKELHRPVWIVRDGKPEASIYINIKEQKKNIQSSVLKVVAEELQIHIEKATGARLPIVERMPKNGNIIVLGGNSVTKKLGIDTEKMEEESYIIKTFKNKIVIAGKDLNVKTSRSFASGTLWGVYDFLERFVGIRWYYPGKLGTIIPKINNLKVEPISYKDRPIFKKRIIYRFHGYSPLPGQDKQEHTYAHFRISDTSNLPTPCHTPLYWSKVYGKTHPEYFQMGADGKRIPPMLCYSEPAVLKQFVNDLERFYKSNGKWREPWGDWHAPSKDAIPVSPIDSPVDCHCPRCRKLINKGSQLGYASQIMGEFLYKLCLEVKKRWPEKTVVFLPYMNYVKPPKGIVFPDNFSVALCWMRTVANLKEPEILKKELEIMNGWRKITKRPLSHWIYTCWPADCSKAPFQYPHVLKNFFTLNKGSTGFFCDAGVDWPRKHMTHYLMARLMWNPDFDVDAALNEYYSLMYGKARKTMSRIFTILIDGWEKSRWDSPLPDYHRISLKNVHSETYPEPVVEELRGLSEKALREVEKNSIEFERIAFFRTALDPFFSESAAFHQGKTRRTLEVLRIGTMPKLDGKLDEDFWNTTLGNTFITLHKEKPEPQFPTTVKGVWIPNKGILFGFRMSEPDPDGIRTNYSSYDDPVYMDDCIEIFLDTKAEHSEFYQIVTNTKGTLFDALYHNPGKAWNSKGVVSRSFISKDFWTLEVYIPFDTLNLKNVRTGRVWFGNFTRSRWRDKGGNELSRLSTSYDLPVPNSNLNTLNFGHIKFIE